MPKKSSSNAPAAEKTVTEAAFLAGFNKKAALAKTAAKKERVSFPDDETILKKLGIGIGERRTYNAAVSKITFGFAKNDTNRPMFQFIYVLTTDDPKAKGTILSNNHIIEEGVIAATGEVWRTEEEAMEKLMGEFQGIGEETMSWKDPIAGAIKAAKDHTAAKTPISITLSCWESKKTKGKVGMNKDINPASATDNSDLEDTEAVDEASDEGFNAEDWIGGWCEFDHEEYGHTRMKVEAYDEESHTFTGTDDTGAPWDSDFGPSADVATWSEDQND